MPSDAERILQRMRRTATGWRPSDFETLYRGFGFDREEGGEHTLYTHPKSPWLNAAVGRHRKLTPGYARHAVRLIDRLLELQAAENKANEKGEDNGA